MNRDGQNAFANIDLPTAPKRDLTMFCYNREFVKKFPDSLELPPAGKVVPARTLKVLIPPESFVVLVEQ